MCCSALSLQDMAFSMYALVLGEETVFSDKELLELTPQLGESGRGDWHGDVIFGVVLGVAA